MSQTKELLFPILKNISQRNMINTVTGKTSPSDIANEINTYFTDIGKLAKIAGVAKQCMQDLVQSGHDGSCQRITLRTKNHYDSRTKT